MFGFAGFDKSPIEISTTRNLRDTPSGIVVHRIVAAPKSDIVVVRGIRSSDPVRTFIDLTSKAEAEAIEIALDDALRRRLVTLPRLQWRLRTIGVNGKRGAALLADLLEERRPASPAAEGPLETRFVRLLKQAGLPIPEKQFEIRDDGKFVARVDFAYPSHKLVIELDGFAHHSGRLSFEKDRERRNWLEVLDWRVINVTDRQMRYGQPTLIERLRKLLP